MCPTLKDRSDRVRVMTNKKVLMLCYFYPPLVDVGCKRSVAFSKYFKKYGWNPYVVSVKNPDKAFCQLGNEKHPENIYVDYTYSLINLYKPLGKINGLICKILNKFNIDIKINYLYGWLCIPDFFWGWMPLTIRKCIHIIKQHQIDYIYVSCLPFSSAIVGALLKHKTGRPLIIDFRDPFALERGSVSGFVKFRMKINRSIEEFILKHADLFIVTSKETRHAYMHQYPYIRDRIFAVHNGFDVDFLKGVKAVPKFPKFTIVYTGEFYFYAPKPELFFQALAILKERGDIHPDNFQFLYYGDGRVPIDEAAARCGVQDLVHAHPRVSYREIMTIIKRSHFELLRIVKLMISTKLFEGISLDIPLLATIPSGEVEVLIRQYSPSSLVITDDAPEKVAQAILDGRAKYERNEIEPNRVGDFLENFSRETLTRNLMTIIEQRLG